MCFTNRDETLARDGACCTQAASDAGDGMSSWLLSTAHRLDGRDETLARGCACDTQMGTVLRLLYFSDFAIFIISSLDSLELSIST